MEASTCFVSANEAKSSARSTFCGERKLLHILEDVVQPHVEQEGDTVGNDDGDKARGEVSRYMGDKNLGASWTDHGSLYWWARSCDLYPCLAQLA